MKKKINIDSGIFPKRLVALVGYSKKEVVEELEKIGFSRHWVEHHIEWDSLPDQGQFFYCSTSADYAMLLPSYKNTPMWHGVASHEISHFCIALMEEIGQPINTTTWETYAYLNGYVTERLYEGLKK